MKESCGKDPASHPDPESCVGGRKDAGEALTGAHVGQPSSCEIRCSGVPTPWSEAEGYTKGGVTGEPSSDPAQSETLGTRGNSPHGKREIPQVPTELDSMGRPGKANGRTSGVHAWGKSDDRIVPGKPRNKGEHVSPAEAVEGRRSTKGSAMSEAVSRTQSRIDAPRSRHRARCRGFAVPPP
jgi:RNA-directed DNA polymerase